jgi:hypothetical protein
MSGFGNAARPSMRGSKPICIYNSHLPPILAVVASDKRTQNMCR